MTANEEGHFDISHMQIQVLRSTFWLLTLAVTILVIFSSVALVRNPSNRPVVNVFVGQNSGVSGDDESTRLKRGAEANVRTHTPAQLDKIRSKDKNNDRDASGGKKKKNKLMVQHFKMMTKNNSEFLGRNKTEIRIHQRQLNGTVKIASGKLKTFQNPIVVRNGKTKSERGRNVGQKSIQDKHKATHLNWKNNSSRPIHHRENISRPKHDRENISRLKHDRENISRPIHHRENISRPIHHRENISRPKHDRENISRPIHHRENISRPKHDRENISRPKHDRENISRPKHDRENISRPIHHRDYNSHTSES